MMICRLDPADVSPVRSNTILRRKNATSLFNAGPEEDATAIAEYKRYHVKIWPEVKQSLFDAGVVDMQIYLLGTRMFMIMDVTDSFSMSAKASMDLANAKVQEWETIMHRFQQQLRVKDPISTGWRWKKCSIWKISND